MRDPDGRLAWPFPQRGCDPPPEYDRLRGEAPLAKVRLYDGSFAWLLTRYTDVRTALRSQALSSDVHRDGFPMPSASARAAKSLQHSFVRMDPPGHTIQRHAVEPFFRRRRLLEITPTIEAIVADAINDLAQMPRPVDVVGTYARRIPAEVACLLLGLPRTDARRLQEMILAWSTYDTGAAIVTTAGADIMAYLDDALEAAPPPASILAALASTHHLGAAERRHIAFLILVSGFHTTANMIALSLLTLLRDPSLRSELRPRLRASRFAVDELLRVLSIARLTALRLATDNVTLAGGVVRPGEGVIASIEAANHDPSVFPHPRRIDFARGTPRHLAFGDGVHNCLGQDLARIELQLALLAFIDRFPAAALAVDERDLRYTNGATRGLMELPVNW